MRQASTSSLRSASHPLTSHAEGVEQTRSALNIRHLSHVDALRGKGVQRIMSINVLPTGSRVYVTSYSPFRGLRGTIHTVHTIPTEGEEPFCFYRVSLEGTAIQEPVWFEYDEIEILASPTFPLEALH